MENWCSFFEYGQVLNFAKQERVKFLPLSLMFQVLSFVILTQCDAAVITNSTGCKNSYDCGSNMCCRDSSGVVISDQDLGGFGPLRPIGSVITGTCSSKKAQKGEMCDSNCDCSTGLLCYRPMSGVCCPPRLCYDEAYVKKQQAYWHNCMSNPSCALPP